MFTFAHGILLGGLALVALPVLIHLINMLRHRRVDWAAMEFLLASQRRNRTRILLKQLLLLLMRMAAIAAIVLMLAKPSVHDQWGRFLGGGKTHHVVLLDDSFSMNDRHGHSTAFEEAKGVIAKIGARAAETGDSRFSLLRFSRSNVEGIGPERDFAEAPVDEEFQLVLQEMLRTLDPSHTAAGPHQTLESLSALLSESTADRHIVYLVSDFREHQWRDTQELRSLLHRLSQQNVKLRLIDCVDTARPNLSVSRLVPLEGVRAAGVPVMMEVEVTNNGTTPASNVTVALNATDIALPAVAFDRIAPGESASERFTVSFPDGGQHVLTASLPPDAIVDDNTRHCVLDVRDSLQVLLVDGDPEMLNARYLTSALSPTGPIKTGVNPKVVQPSFLASNELDEYAAIFLLDVEYLEKSAIAAIEGYVASGGGLAVFLGPSTDVQHVNSEWLRDGDGFFPCPIEGQDVLLTDRIRNAPDLQVEQHPLFRVFAGKRSTFLSTVGVQRYIVAPTEFPEGTPESTQAIAHLRNGSPLVIDSRFGEGKVVTYLTTAAPQWNNWARGNPSFVVAMLELQAYLGVKPYAEDRHAPGAPIEIAFDATEFGQRVIFQVPVAGGVEPTAVDASPSESTRMRAVLAEAERSGLYRAELSSADGAKQERLIAVNVDSGEGRSPTLDGMGLSERLPDVEFEYADLSAFTDDSGDSDEKYNLAGSLFVLLVLLLIGEQLLAYSASYHAPRAKADGIEQREGGRA